MINKQEAFNLFVHTVITNYMKQNSMSIDEFRNDNNFSKLKLLNLLFLFVVNDIRNNDGTLHKIFNYFVATSYGATEWDVYNHLKYYPNASDIINFVLNVDNHEDNINNDLTTLFNLNYEQIYSQNSELFNYNGGRLTELSRRHTSWRYACLQAHLNNKNYFEMKNEYIKEDYLIVTLYGV